MSKNVVVISTSHRAGDINGNDKLSAAYEMGKNI